MNKSPTSDQIQRFAKDLGGVFTFSDLWSLIGQTTSDRTAKVANRLVRNGVLLKVRRGIYVTKDADLWVLASRLREKCYISLDSVLAKAGLVGATPGNSVSAVSTGNPKTVQTPIGRIRYFKIKPELIFGLNKETNGVSVADVEKAYIDLLYYYMKGARSSIDPLKDVDLWKLNPKRVRQYLKEYRNLKFQKFVLGLIKGKENG